ncbi:hypothetical protein N2152v2_009752 [Parachlorella kessleri]
MASTRNAFELLLGNATADQAASKAGKKKSKKKKRQGAPDEGPSDLQPTQEAVVVEDEEENGAGFQPVPQHHVVKAKAAAPEPKSRSSDKPAKASEITSALEREAAAPVGRGRAALASKWADQARVQQAVAGPKYAEGSRLLDFKQVLVQSKALDLLVESYLSGCSAADAASLAGLLAAAAHPEAPAELPGALAAAVVGLGQLAGSDPLSVSTHAARSVAAALGLLKAGLPSAGELPGEAHPVGQLGLLGSKLRQLEAQLPKMASLKEQVRLWGDIFAITQQKLDVLRSASEGTRVPQEVQAVLGPLESLHGALETRVKEVQEARSGASVEAQLARAEANFKQDDAGLQARLSEVEGRVRALEAELAGLRQEAIQLRERRTWATQHQQQLAAKIKSGAADSAAAEAELQSSLKAVDKLSATLLAAAKGSGPSFDVDEVAAQLMQHEVPNKFVGSVQQLVEQGLKLLQEMAGKAQFYRERLTQAMRQSEHLALLKLADAKQKEEHKKQTDNLQKMLQDVLAVAESVGQSCQQAATAYRQRLGLLLSLPNFPPPPPNFGAHLEALAHQAQELVQSIKEQRAVPQRAASRSLSPEKARASSGPTSNGGPAAPAVAAPPAAAPAAPAPIPGGGDVAALEQRLAQLEEQNKQKDAQIAALLSTATVEVPSPVPAMLGPPPAAAAPSRALGMSPAAAAALVIPTGPVFDGGQADSPSLFSQPPAGLSTPVASQPASVAGARPMLPRTTSAGAHAAATAAAAAAVEGLQEGGVAGTSGPASFAQALAAGRGRARH